MNITTIEEAHSIINRLVDTPHKKQLKDYIDQLAAENKKQQRELEAIAQAIAPPPDEAAEEKAVCDPLPTPVQCRHIMSNFQNEVAWRKRLEAWQKTVCTMLGWMNIPPQRTIEMEISAIKARDAEQTIELTRLKTRLRHTAQTIIAVIGSNGPEDADEAALRIAPYIAKLKDQILTKQEAAIKLATCAMSMVQRYGSRGEAYTEDLEEIKAAGFDTSISGITSVSYLVHVAAEALTSLSSDKSQQHHST